MRINDRFGSVCLAVLLLLTAASGRAAAEPGTLEHVGGFTHDVLRTVVGLEVSPDGEHLYAAAFSVNAITVFTRDAETGELTPVQAIQDNDNLDGVTSLRLSADGRYAVAAAFRSGTVVLYERDKETGHLTKLDVAREGEHGVSGLHFAILADFSPDGRHVYAIDGSDGGVVTLAVTDDRELQWIQRNTGGRRTMAGSRGLAIMPSGAGMAVTNAASHTVAVLDRDAETGRTSVRQILRDGEEAEGLGGAFGVAAADDGAFLYTVSGRFGGDQAVSVFRRGEDGAYSLLEEFIRGRAPRLQAATEHIVLASAAAVEPPVRTAAAPADGLGEFEGGNVIIVSPDGLNVYATATVSGAVACFARDPEHGRLTHLETLVHDAGHGILAGAAGVICSPDGRFVYVAAEHGRTISIYRRRE